jgi:hypothetical protein
MKEKRLSSLTRAIDLNYPTNRAITIIAFFCFFGASGFEFILRQDFFTALEYGFRAGISIFLTWAFARELDPDKELSAFFATFLGFIGLLFIPFPFLLALLLELLLIRLINRSTGLRSKSSDALILLLLSSWISLQGLWVFGLLTAIAFFLDSFLPEPNLKNRAFGAAAFIITIFCILNYGGTGQVYFGIESKIESILFVIATTLLFVPKILMSRKIDSRGDSTGTPLYPVRVQGAQILALLSIFMLTILDGWQAVGSLMPVWAAILGISLYSYLGIVLQKVRKAQRPIKN